MSTSYIELDHSALQNNVDFIKRQIDEKCTLSSVIKGNAYGHGIETYAPMAWECGIQHFSVFSCDEARRVNTVVPDATVMIMGHITTENMEWVIQNDIEFFVFDMHRLKQVLEVSKRVGKPAIIHLEIETGMNRTGMEAEFFPAVAELFKNHPEDLRFKGLCTHFAGAESIANNHRVRKQIVRFKKTRKWFEGQGLKPEQCHTACSAASISYPDTQMDMVRIGIMLYGFWPSKETRMGYQVRTKSADNPLKRLISWKSTVMSLKHVEEGDFIGYGTSYLSDQPMRIAAVPVGYGYGYSRLLSNQGRVLINGNRVGVVGMVNMNMMLVDVTLVDSVKPGDDVILIGQQGDVEMSVSAFGELSVQVNYELLTRLPYSIPRKVINH